MIFDPGCVISSVYRFEAALHDRPRRPSSLRLIVALSSSGFATCERHSCPRGARGSSPHRWAAKEDGPVQGSFVRLLRPVYLSLIDANGLDFTELSGSIIGFSGELTHEEARTACYL